MKYLFDSNTLSDLYNVNSAQHHSISKKLSQLSNSDELAISIVTLYELEYAYHNAPDTKKMIIRNDINHLKQNFIILPLSAKSAEVFGLLKKKFKDLALISKENIKKHNIDIMLASVAICEPCVLISADKIYSSLQTLTNGLYVEDWT
ncbi:MAG: type II toxin-antitoxin system VapC family toxin [Methylococcaceae bacterium]